MNDNKHTSSPWQGRYSSGSGLFRIQRSTFVIIIFLGLAAAFNYERDPRVCSDMAICKTEGKCYGSPPCQARGDAGCQASSQCKSMGRCREYNNQCVLADAFCAAQSACNE